MSFSEVETFLKGKGQTLEDPFKHGPVKTDLLLFYRWEG